MEIVGIDWAWEKHTCYLLSEKRTLKIEDTVNGYEKLIKLAGDAVFVIEDPNTRIGNYLLGKGKAVYFLSPARSKKAVGYHSNSRKSDKQDARSLALTFKEHSEYCHKLKHDEYGLELKELFNLYGAIGDIIQQSVSRLTDQLHRCWPEYLAIMGGCTSKLNVQFIIALSDKLNSLSEVSVSQVRELMKEIGARPDRKFLKKVARLLDTDYLPISEYRAEHIAKLASDIVELGVRHKKLEKTMKEKLRQSPYKDILSIPGIGTINGMALVVAFTTYSFTSYRELQQYAGTVPVTSQSGSSRYVKLRRNCNHYLRSLLHMAAMSLKRKSFWAKVVYKKKRKQGCSHNLALRELANTLVKISFAVMKNLEPYNEEKFLSSHPKINPHQRLQTQTMQREILPDISQPEVIHSTYCQVLESPG